MHDLDERLIALKALRHVGEAQLGVLSAAVKTGADDMVEPEPMAQKPHCSSAGRAAAEARPAKIDPFKSPVKRTARAGLCSGHS